MHFRKNSSGATMVEFALALPILIILIFGAIDAAWMAYQWNAASKATQLGARWAAVNDPVSTAFDTARRSDAYITDPQQVGQDCALPGITCQVHDYTCPGNGCSAPRMDALLAEMRRPFPWLQQGEFQIRYYTPPAGEPSLGFVSRPGGTPVWIAVSMRCRNFSVFLVDRFLGWISPDEQEGCSNGPGIPLRARYQLSSEAMASAPPE